MAQKTIKVGLLGFGVIGSGVARMLQQNAKLISDRVGAKLELAAIADLNIRTDRGVKVDKKILTTDGFAVCTNPAIDIVIELVGGIGIAGKFVETALRAGKHVVTANKALLSERGQPLFELAERQGRLLLFEAAVGGAIPIIRTLKQDLAGEQIDQIFGIVNGTCNYILTKLAEGGDYATTLREAQKLGYAEADPTLDVSGGDTAHKLALLAMLAFGTTVDFKKIHTEGITELSTHDFTFARRLNRVIKLVAVAKRDRTGIELRVSPTMLPASSTLAQICDSVNAIQLTGPNLGSCLLSGRGAGSLPTATAVVGDLIEAARAILLGESNVPVRATQPEKLQNLPIKPIETVQSEYYLRFTVRDEPGVLNQISGVLSKHQLSIRDILQLDLQEFKKSVPLVVILHLAEEGKVRQAVREIDRLHCTKEKTVVLRVEE